MTVQDLLYDARALLDEYNEDGVVIPPTDVASLESNGLRFINMGLQEIYLYARYYTTYPISQTPTEQQLADRKMILHALPTDFYQLVEVIENNENRTPFTGYKLEGNRDLYLPATFTGDVDVIYISKLSRITDTTTELPTNNIVADQFLTYYVAAKMAMTENPQIAGFFEQKSNELKFDAKKGQPANEIKITDVYFGG